MPLTAAVRSKASCLMHLPRQLQWALLCPQFFSRCVEIALKEKHHSFRCSKITCPPTSLFPCPCPQMKHLPEAPDAPTNVLHTPEISCWAVNISRPGFLQGLMLIGLFRDAPVDRSSRSLAGIAGSVTSYCSTSISPVSN